MPATRCAGFDDRAVADRRGLHRPGGAGADRHEEADRLFVDFAHGLRHAGLLHLQRARHGRRAGADDFARLRLRRACSCASACCTTACTRARSPITAAWPTRMPVFAASSCCSPWPTAGLPGTSGFVGEFMVIMGAMQGQFLVRLRRRDHADLRRGLHAVDVQARDLRRGRQRACRRAAGHQCARVPDAGRARAAVLGMGLYPLPFTEVMHVSVNDLLAHVCAQQAAGLQLDA